MTAKEAQAGADTAIATTTGKAELEAAQRQALMRAIGLDKLPVEQRELVLNIAKRYDLDLLLKHLVMIDGRPYITRDGLLHVAHRSGHLDGIEVTTPILEDGYWRASASVFRKDMGHPFTYAGRYPDGGRKGRPSDFAPEMALKVAEVMALRRAFDVSLPSQFERWDREDEASPEAQATTAKVRTVADTIRDRAQGRVTVEAADAPLADQVAPGQVTVEEAVSQVPQEPSEPQDEAGDLQADPDPDLVPGKGKRRARHPGQDAVDDARQPVGSGQAVPDPEEAPRLCGDPSPYDDGNTCGRAAGHPGIHRTADQAVTW